MSEVNTDQEALARLVSLPTGTSEVWWTSERKASSAIPGPDDEVLVAILKLAPGEQETVLRERARVSATLPESSLLSRFPDDVAERLQSMQTGDGSTIELSAYSVEGLTRPPFLNGYLLPLGGDMLLLYLYTM